MEDEGEIEYLEEDEDLVQQILQNTQPKVVEPSRIEGSPSLHEDALLVERRRQGLKRNHVPDDDDSDYDPTEDFQNNNDDSDDEYDPSEDLQLERGKKKKVAKKYNGPSSATSNLQLAYKKKISNVLAKVPSLKNHFEDKLKSLPNITIKKRPTLKTQTTSVKPQQKQTVVKRISYQDLVERRKLDIRIPDYEDPICLPVRALKQENLDLKRLKQWNNLCLGRHKKLDIPLKYGKEEIVKSSRMVILKNVKDSAGKINTNVFGRTTATDSDGNSKTESYQSSLPRYREKKVLPAYPLPDGGANNNTHVYEVILSKESSKDADHLVVYKPKEAVSAVYKFIEKESSAEEQDNEEKRVLKEVTCAKACAPCYQTSWRGLNKETGNTLQCSLCERFFTSVYSLLTHLKLAHTHAEVNKAKDAIAAVLGKVLEYHYKCRICQERFRTTKELRKHVSGRHQGVEVFRCEVGGHMTS